MYFELWNDIFRQTNCSFSICCYSFCITMYQKVWTSFWRIQWLISSKMVLIRRIIQRLLEILIKLIFVCIGFSVCLIGINSGNCKLGGLVFNWIPDSENCSFFRFGTPAESPAPKCRRFGRLWIDSRFNLRNSENEVNCCDNGNWVCAIYVSKQQTHNLVLN